MRDILFRGRTIGTGVWVDGSLFIDDKKDKHEICVGYVNYRVTWEVEPATVGQYTGLVDKNGRKIFEGDILRIKTDCFSMKGVVEFNDGTLIVTDGELTECLWYQPSEMEVIGNIHDNPELMKAGEE